MWERPPVVSDGLCLGYWFFRCDCFWLFLRFGRGFVLENVVAGCRAVAFALVLPSAVFGFQQPADGVQYLARFGFVVAAAYFDFKRGRVYPVFRVFPRLFAVRDFPVFESACFSASRSAWTGRP